MSGKERPRRRGPKPAKAKVDAKLPVARKSPKSDSARVRDLEQRLAEARQREADAVKQESEALERQTATAEVLRIISGAPTDLQPVFDAILDSVMRLFRPWSANVCQFDGELIHLAATRGGPSEAGRSIRDRFPTRPTAGLTVGRCILDRAVIEIHDVETDAGLVAATREMARARGWRSALAVPMLRDGEPVGAIMVTRIESGRFESGSVELLQTFADQAIIALENVRLFKELETRNHELAHSLEQQTATSEILRVISSSPTDVQPVFNAIVESAIRLSGAGVGHLFRFDGQLLYLGSSSTTAFPDYDELLDRLYPMAPNRGQVSGRAILSRTVVQIPDVLTDLEYRPDVALAGSWRSRLGVPLLRDGSPIGVIVINRTEPGLFSDSHIELLKTFADQAVIAIENVRLFTELEARNRDLTATSEILQVISRSPTEVQPVFEAIADSAMRLFGAWSAVILRYDGEFIRLAAVRGGRSSEKQLKRLQVPRRPSESRISGPAVLTRTVRQIVDVETDASLVPEIREIAREVGWRSAIYVPMLRGDDAVGAIGIHRAQPGAFSSAEIALLQTFADQAVIAIENVRLFNETKEALERQVATAEILSVISASPTALQPVFDTIARNAVQLIGGLGSTVFQVRDGIIHMVGQHNISAEALAAAGQIYPLPVAAEGSPLARVIRDGVLHHMPDIDRETTMPPEILRVPRALGVRSHLIVPMLREGIAIGGIVVGRAEVGPFSNEQIELLKTFADQAVIAIENVRLFKELEASSQEIAEKGRQIEIASQHKSEFLANMSHELRTPLNAIIGFSEVLNERMFGDLNEKQDEYLKDIHASGQHLLSLINDILDLSKIEAGRMELELSDFHLPTALDSALTLVRERAGRRSIALHLSVDERLGQIQADERKVRQVVLNLLSNAIKFTPEGGRIEVGAALQDGVVEVSVTDTGVGIAAEDQEAVFEEFRQVGTADKKVEGTGLGLTLCRKFVELHGGKIWVKSHVGEGSTFTFTIPAHPAG